ncbi:putative nwd2 protein [Mycena sanguinolenta]|uniref:Putative nwd2 protein n=1 Tax=Mycena sanguinolenta TaxID=230812 RepID=A0A8H6YS83_9AGAR|nr:putative nwd2 protein [Mycena sanguinolenta]
MQNLAGQLQDAGRLGASFFFKRGHTTRGNAKALFSTIAYQLAISVPWLREPISQIVENDPSVVARSIDIQMRKLISEPCSPYKDRYPLAIIIDGLDECEGHDIQENILRILRSSSSDYTIPFRFFVASRPEPHIHEMFDSSFYSDHHCSVNVEQSFDAVNKYLCDEFARIHREHSTMAMVSSPWPAEDVVKKLVQKSSGHFIYASTIIKFIDDKNYHPTQRLAVVQCGNSTGPQSAFDLLDQLYVTILNSAPRQSELVPILVAIVNFEVSPEEIDQLFRLAEGDTRLRLRGLHSLLIVPSNKTDRISSHHASFLDFLDNPGRSGTFCVGTLNHRIDLARCVLETYVVPHEDTNGFWSRFLNFDLMPFINSLPPSAAVAELLPLIGTMDPGCVFASTPSDVPRSMLEWLKKIPSALPDLLKLWEDYECMASFEATILWKSPIHPSVKRILACSPEFRHIFVSLVVFQQCGYCKLLKLRDRLDLTWTEMRTFICGLSSNVASDEHGLSASAVRTAFRGAALQCIRKMVKNQLDIGGRVYSGASRDAAWESFGKRQIDDHHTEEETYKRVVHRREQSVSVIAIGYFY